MEKILFINACVRDASRSLRLARHLLGRLGSGAGDTAVEIGEIDLRNAGLQAISSFDMLERRESLVRSGQTGAPELRYARQFAEADTIVIAAPYWDLAFPALLKIYLEHVTVTGVTFRYSPEGRPVGMCRARRLYYVTTCGGPAVFNMGYDYICTLCRNFFGINDIKLFMAENLDVVGNDPEQIMASALAAVDMAAERGELKVQCK